MKMRRLSGLTLLELVATISIVGIIVGVSALYVREVISLWDYVTFRGEAVAQGRQTAGRIARDLRRIRNTTAVNQASASALSFVNSDNITVNYTYSGGILSRDSQVLLQGLSNFSFTYYNVTGAVIASPQVAPLATDIQRIGFSMTIGGSRQNKTVGSLVFPRNLGVSQ